MYIAFIEIARYPLNPRWMPGCIVDPYGHNSRYYFIPFLRTFNLRNRCILICLIDHYGIAHLPSRTQ